MFQRINDDFGVKFLSGGIGSKKNHMTNSNGIIESANTDYDIHADESRQMGDPLTDTSPLISAASCGKLRLVRLLVEGGAQVNRSNQRGETPLLAACKALRGEPAGKERVKLLRFLLQNKADPNAQDQEGRTALMYACMQRAGAPVASALVAAGADPCIEDGSGASALVYAINAQHQPTVQVLIDACRAKGRDIIIIATETGANRGPVTRKYLNIPPSPDSSPTSCMSPSDIILKTGSPSSPEGGNIFNFRGTTGKHGSGSRRSSFEPSQSSPCSGPASRQRVSSEPWLTINDLDSLQRAYERGVRERNLGEEGRGDEDVEGATEDAGFTEDVRKCRSKNSVTTESDGGDPKRIPSPRFFHLRRNTLPSVTAVNPPLHLPPLTKQPDSHLQVPANNVLPAGIRRAPGSSSSSPRTSAPAGAALLPLLPQASRLLAPPGFRPSERSRRSARRHSAQLEQK